MKQVAVISGKGGTGKSSISAAFATLNHPVVIADCDVDAANLYLLFNPSHEEEQVYAGSHKAVIDYNLCTACGLCIDHCRFDAISLRERRITIDPIACDGCYLCSRICPENAITMAPEDRSRLYSGSFRNGRMVYGRLAPGEENSGKLVSMVREKARQLSEKHKLETIILDGPPGIGCPVISTITGADKIIIVTEPTVSGLHDLERAAGIAEKSGRKPYVIINKWDLNRIMADKICDWCRENDIPVAGMLPFDRLVVQAMLQGKAVTELAPDSDTGIELKKIWNKILTDYE